SEETCAELPQIAWVPLQIILPQANKPIMGIMQDTHFVVSTSSHYETCSLIGTKFKMFSSGYLIGMVMSQCQPWSSQNPLGWGNKF
ncbi:hypothetical protein EDD16DRAFT_1474818, partial [Pisolithus croceorrhizus]